jgi:hypothetical protein
VVAVCSDENLQLSGWGALYALYIYISAALLAGSHVIGWQPRYWLAAALLAGSRVIGWQPRYWLAAAWLLCRVAALLFSD